jgi:DNA-3-methyladenine glycosylase II
MARFSGTLAVPPGYRFDLALRYFASSPSTITERIDAESYRRALRYGSTTMLMSVEPDGAGLRVAVEGPAIGRDALAHAQSFARVVLGTAGPPVDLAEAVAADPIARALVERYRGMPIVAIGDPFEALCWAILGQQITVQFAAQCKRNLLAAFGTSITAGDDRFDLFPSPARLADADPEYLRSLQLSRQKARYIIALAQAVRDGTIDLEALRHLPGDAAIAAVTELVGIGRWTAEYLLLRGFGRADAIPAGDMGLRAVIGRLYGFGRHATEAEIRALAENWRPYRGYLAFYFWFALQQRHA